MRGAARVRILRRMPHESPLDRHAEALEGLRAAILEGPGVLTPQTRDAAARAEGVPEPFSTYVDAIHRHAYRITDEVLAGLREVGASQDQVFEVTVSAAYGAARARFEAGLRALREAQAGA